ncbi:MAG: 2-hydroxychromene-2-carboxylate isomerase [Betaproteobacteria bacterium]|nr:2-hydroxychromene-2-carboxylate isomerase [Betaproteobacteria bacterium]
MSKQLDFFYFIGSTYTYLAVMRAEELARQAGVSLNWRPFSVRTLMREQENIPFSSKPLKLKYMWRDVERRAERHGLDWRDVPKYPIDAEERANRVATLAAMEGWCPQFTRAAYRTWFLEGQDPGEQAALAALLAELGKDPQSVIAAADETTVREQYLAETDTARQLGLFGSPTFVCGSELFWGDDRLEDALAWCLAH